MPELVPTLRTPWWSWPAAATLAARVLSLVDPPPYLGACSQGAWTDGDPFLVRNYDYLADRVDGEIWHTAWTGRGVIGTGDQPVGPARRAERGRPGGLADVRRAAPGRPRFRNPPRRPLSPGDVRLGPGGRGGPASTARPPGPQPDPARSRRPVLDGLPCPGSRTGDRSGRGGHQPPGRGGLAGVHGAHPVARARDPDHPAAGRSGGHARGVRRRVPRPTDLRFRPAAGHFGTLYTAVLRPVDGVVEYRWPSFRWRQAFEAFEPGTHVELLAAGPGDPASGG